MDNTHVKIAPSILSADFSRLGDAVKMLERAKADWIHFDVMDGHFVPNITFGASMLKALRPHSQLPMDAHLMVSRPGDWIDAFLEAGADYITFHVEAETHIQRQLQRIRAGGAKAGLVLNPATPVDVLTYVLGDCDIVLLMSVNPGFGGQSFLPATLQKIKDLRAMITKQGADTLIEVDGGINPQTAPLCIAAGADVLVAGNAVFSATLPDSMIRRLRGEKE